MLLVFITVFTQQRAARLRALWDSRPARGEAGEAAAITAALAGATFLVLLSGLRLWLETLDDLCLLPDDGEEAARTLFFLAWLLLAGLILWQLTLVKSAVALYRSRPATRRR